MSHPKNSSNIHSLTKSIPHQTLSQNHAHFFTTLTTIYNGTPNSRDFLYLGPFPVINLRMPGIFAQPKDVSPCNCGQKVRSANPSTHFSGSVPAESVADPLDIGSVEVFAEKFSTVKVPHLLSFLPPSNLWFYFQSLGNFIRKTRFEKIQGLQVCSIQIYRPGFFKIHLQSD